MFVRVVKRGGQMCLIFTKAVAQFRLLKAFLASTSSIPSVVVFFRREK